MIASLLALSESASGKMFRKRVFKSAREVDVCAKIVSIASYALLTKL